MDRCDVARLVRRAGHLLTENLWEYWPVAGRDALSERNIALVLGHTLFNAGFRCYADADSRAAGARTVDVLALHPDHGLAVLADVRRLVGPSDACAAVVDTVERFRTFELRESPATTFRRLGILAAVTHDNDVARAWAMPGLERKRLPGWEGFVAPPDSADWGTVLLSGYDEELEGNPAPGALQWLVYVVLALPPGSPPVP